VPTHLGYTHTEPSLRTPAEYAKDLRLEKVEWRAGRLPQGEYLAYARQVWVEVLGRGLAAEVAAEIEKGDGESLHR
jgi:hypothetical protein